MLQDWLGQGPTKLYENEAKIQGAKADVDRITSHVLGVDDLLS